MSIFTKRNAFVGYVTLKAASRALERRRRRKRNGLRIVLLVALGLVSIGILAGLVAVALRRARLQDESAAEEAVEEVVSAVAEGTLEPIPAT